MIERKTIYAFGDWIIAELGDCYTRGKIKGKEMGLSEEEIRKVYLTAFELLGEKSALSLRTLNQTVARKK